MGRSSKGGKEGGGQDLRSSSRCIFIEDASVVKRLLLGITEAWHSPCCVPSPTGIIRKDVAALNVLQAEIHIRKTEGACQIPQKAKAVVQYARCVTCSAEGYLQ